MSMPKITYIGIDKAVASIQMDIATSAASAPVLSPGITSKQLAAAPISGGYRVLIFGLNQLTISGRIVDVPGTVTGITGVVAADPNANPITVVVKRVSTPGPLTVTTRLR